MFCFCESIQHFTSYMTAVALSHSYNVLLIYIYIFKVHELKPVTIFVVLMVSSLLTKGNSVKYHPNAQWKICFYHVLNIIIHLPKHSCTHKGRVFHFTISKFGTLQTVKQSHTSDMMTWILMISLHIELRV